MAEERSRNEERKLGIIGEEPREWHRKDKNK
jgi:hypothetical protein